MSAVEVNDAALAASAVHDAINRLAAANYEAGFAVGERAGTEKAMANLSQNDVTVRGLTPEFKETLHNLLDRIQLFRQMIGVNDTRYSTLGEIVRDFATALGTEPHECTRVNSMRADHVIVGDMVLYEIDNEWHTVENTLNGRGTTVLCMGKIEWMMQQGDVVQVRRP